jgi:hypothetical protein
MNLLHMVTTDPARTPTFTQFADPNYFLFTDGATCDVTDAGANPCTTLEGPSGFAWNHGDVNPDITTTWLGMVGPGVAPTGVDSTTWADHTDIRPTILALVGLKDDYAHDGRVLTEDLQGWAVPAAVHNGYGIVLQLAQTYKQLNATVGQLGLDSLAISTRAVDSGSSANDSTYTNLENQLSSITTQRNALAAQMIAMLENAEFNGQSIDKAQAQSLIAQGQTLLSQVHTMAAEAG